MDEGAATRAPRALAQEAARLHSEVSARAGHLHEPGVRDAHRALLGETIEVARAAGLTADVEVKTSARWILLRALVARAEDARYGAGQLSRGSQRAPTPHDCDDGWQRVEGIVKTAEAAAEEAEAIAGAIADRRATRLADAARRAAEAARKIVDDRNHAYTFHANPGFSFGEGWYLGAAAVLTGVRVQIEPDQPQTAQVTRFLRDAGLEAQLAPYRPRPRANKPLTHIVARAFSPDPAAAQDRLRRAFGCDGPLSEDVVRWAEAGLAEASDSPKILLWVRYARHHPDRNTPHAELEALADLCRRLGVVPVLVGDALRDGPPPRGAVDWTLFWKQATFQGEDMRQAQLHLFEHLRREHHLRGQIGVTTAGMDGPALMGLPTMYITAAPNVRLGEWVGAVPGYEEVVRDARYLARIETGVRRWRES